MRTLKMSIKNNGKTIGFKIDREIIEGLYITFDLDKVTDNYNNFNIKYDSPIQNEIAIKGYNKKNVIILNFKLDNDNHVQYIIGKNMCIKEFNKIADNIVPSYFKDKIKEFLNKYNQNIDTKLFTLQAQTNNTYYSISS